jgi:hypothetical protein
VRTDVFSGREGILKVSVKSDWKNEISTLATGDSRLGKGTLGAIPLHLIFSTENLQLVAKQPHRWRLDLTVSDLRN